MQWIVNELSIDGNFRTVDEFFTAFLPFIQIREAHKVIQEGLICSRDLGNQPVLADTTFSKAVMSHQDRDTRSLILGWINKQGPYWDDERAHNDEDYFEHQGTDVTDTSLGECSRRILLDKDVNALSVLSPTSQFSDSPLITIQGLPEEPICEVEIPNIINADTLIGLAETHRERPKDWTTATALLRDKFNNLVISTEVEGQLQPHPFSTHVLDRVKELLGILQRLIISRDVAGNYTDETNELIANFFSGGNALFTDESDSNKNNFREALTFKDPLNPDSTLFCPFHGKIRSQQFRIHFEMPKAADHVIKIVYIGPKITKD